MIKDTLTALAATHINPVGDANETLDPGATNSQLINILNTIVGSLGIVAVIVVIIGGVLYMTSSGEPGKVKKAKDTILYGIIGLIICALAFAIVNFVISQIGA
ncbi:MAG: hypothetical protein Q4A33_00765 [Candidatus Saccharibacteria bacterium]|nr:hypothetical protein [Candidatus Saccharibacteria bacterium]